MSDGLFETSGSVACLIGEKVWVLARRSDVEDEAGVEFGDLEFRGPDPVRILESTIGNVALLIAQLPSAPDSNATLQVSESGRAIELQSCIELVDLFTALAMGPNERAALLKTLIGPLAVSFQLQADPHFVGLLSQLALRPELPHAKAEMTVISGSGNTILSLSARTGLADADTFVLLNDRLTPASLLGSVAAYMPGSVGVTHAIVDFEGEIACKGVLLLIKDARIARLDIEFRLIDGINAVFDDNTRLDAERTSALARFANQPILDKLRVMQRNRPGKFQPVHLPQSGFTFSLDLCISLESGLFISGWLDDPDMHFKGAIVIDHSLADPVLENNWVRFPAMVEMAAENRPVSCFCAFFPRCEGAGWLENPAVMVSLSGGETHMAVADPATGGSIARRRAILSTIHPAGLAGDGMTRVFKPAICDIHQSINARQSIAKVSDLGSPSSRRTSILIPLYREFGFIRSQILAFASDPFIRETCEIVYILDDPEREGLVNFILGGTRYVTDLDIRLVVLSRNGGYSMANNLGASVARGQMLVLMNSDVLPDGAGWLERCIEELRQLPAGSVIGPKLLYADHSIQHAGMYFFQMPQGEWQNMHYYKGYGSNFASANVARFVPALTGALMVLKRSDFLKVGGFTTDYVIGDYEDSDLCLKLTDLGGKCRYLPEIFLWHFERQSMADGDQQTESGSTTYNRALHSAKWSRRISELMVDPAYREGANVN